MRNKLFIGSALALVLAFATAALAGVFVKAKPAATLESAKTAQSTAEAQPYCRPGECCPVCCDLPCCFPDLTRAKAEAPKTSEACCAKLSAKKVESRCSDGCRK